MLAVTDVEARVSFYGTIKSVIFLETISHINFCLNGL